MGLKQLKRIKNNRELSTYDPGKENFWNTSKQSYSGYNGWDWGTGTYNNQIPNSAPSGVHTYTSPSLSFSSKQKIQPIQQSTQQPGQTLSKLSSAGYAGEGAALGIATSAIGFAGSVANSFGGVQSTQQLQNDAGTGYSSIGGISYTKQNDINKDMEMKQLGASNTSNTLGSTTSGMALGGAIGSVAGPVGGLIGAGIGGVAGLVTGLFGGSSRKRKLRRKMYEAQQLTDRTNQFNRSDADTQSLQQQYAQQYGNNDGQLLYANKGKDIKNDFKKKRIVLKQPKQSTNG